MKYPAVRVLVVGLAVCAIAGCSSSSKPDASGATSTTATTTSTTSPPTFGPAAVTSQQRLPGGYQQGVARIPGGWIFSATDSLWRTDNALKVLQHTSPAIPAAWKAKGFNHVGDVDVVGKYIYAPFEQPDYSKGQQATARYDRDTLQFVDAVVLAQHENSFVTVDPKTTVAYTMDHFDGQSLLRYDVAHGWKSLAPLRMDKVLHRTQGGDIALGQIWISTDDPRHGVYRVDLQSGAATLVAEMGHAGGEGEGIDATQLPSGLLHAMCVDPKFEPVWFEHIRVPIS
ncbi:MAG: hypothetical protein QOC79_1840 [Actinomycetota bacterium]|nr:hypothetical protein [Actinomycetota bacterium]